LRIVVFGSECSEDKLPLIRHLFDKLYTYNSKIFIRKSFSNFLEYKFGYIPAVSGIYDESQFLNTDNMQDPLNIDHIDVAFSIGGDGTFLRTACIMSRLNVPILGINTGRLGFLAEVNSTQIDEMLEELFSGKYHIEERTMLQLQGYEASIKGGNLALNEIAVLKRDTSSMITIHTFLDDDYLTSYKADGLVIATPTGSTAYSMSVGGPVLLPQNRNFILSPVAPHSLNMRPIVVPDNVKIMLNVESRTNSLLVSLDGRNKDFTAGNSLIISKSTIVTRLIKRINQTFHQTLREKLMWGVDARS